MNSHASALKRTVGAAMFYPKTDPVPKNVFQVTHFSYGIGFVCRISAVTTSAVTTYTHFDTDLVLTPIVVLPYVIFRTLA